MKRAATAFLVGLGSLAGAFQASASISVTLETTPQTISVGQNTTLDIVVSGLAAQFASPHVGAFSFTFAYDDAVLLANSITYGSYLDRGFNGSVRISDLTTPGLFAFEVSLEDPSLLNAEQPSSFTLATIGFQGIGAGVSLITMDAGSLSDEEAESLDFDFTGASITVESHTGPGEVPEPGTVAAAAVLGLMVGGTVLRMRRSR